MTFDFDKQYWDFTLDFDDAVATPRCQNTTVDFSSRTPDQFQSTSVLNFSPHAVTHLNILPPQAEYDGPYTKKQELHSLWKARVGQFSEKYLWPTILLDMSKQKQEAIADMTSDLDKATGDSEYISLNVNDGTIDRLVQALAIEPDDITQTCGDKRELSDRIVIFYTNWRRFSPRNRDLGSPFWEGRHPFLLNPHLTPKSVELLHEYRAVGIGIDAFSIEHPLLSATRKTKSKLMPSNQDDKQRGTTTGVYNSLLLPENNYLPIIECLLIQESLLHVHQFSANFANIVASPRRKSVRGLLAIFLIDDSLEHSAIPARVLFQEQ